MRASILLFSLIIYTLSTSQLKAQPQIDLESGLVFPGYIDVRIPGDEGTLFSLKDDLKPNTSFFYRIRADYTIKSRHSISVLYAPLQIKSKGSVIKDILFQGVVFPANQNLESVYKFNSYRLTYRFDFIKKPKVEFGLGITGKIRDAKIALSSAGLNAEKTNVGFVPLINFRLMWYMYDKLGLLLYGDALAAPQGRAEDVLIAATYKLSDRLIIRAGYRILEGGADNSTVYNFSLFNYLSFGVTYTFYNNN